MINLNLSSENLQDPKVVRALGELFQALGDHDTSIKTETKTVAKKPRNRSHSRIFPMIDADISAKYRGVISSKKSLHALSLLKIHREISSLDLYDLISKTYPDLHPRAMGGIFGAIERWFRQRSERAPFVKERDRHGSLIFKWID